MDLNKVSVRYAKALFLTSKEKNNLDDIYKDINVVRDIFNEAPEISALYDNPTIKTVDKIKITNSIFGNKVEDLILQTLLLVIKNKREVYLKGIIRNFIDLYKAEKDVKTVELITSDPISENIKSEIITKVKDAYKSEVELQHSNNESLIGGFILRVDGKQYDASVSSKLNTIRQSLINTTFEKKLPKIEN